MLQQRIPTAILLTVAATATAFTVAFITGSDEAATSDATAELSAPAAPDAQQAAPSPTRTRVAIPPPISAADGPLSLSVAASHSAISRLEEPQTVWVRVKIDAAKVESAERPPIDVALVVDRSASMSGDKLNAAKTSAHGLLARMAPGDRLAVVTFDDLARLEHELADVATGSESLRTAIDSIHVRGGTNISGGYDVGLEALTADARPSSRVIFLLSDGQANRGIVNSDELGNHVARGMAAHDVTVSTLGIGDGFNENTLGAIAVRGGGNFHYAEGPEKLEAQLSQEFAGLSRAAARHGQLRITPSAGVTVRNVYGFPHSSEAGATIVQLDTLFSQAQRQAIVELDVHGSKLTNDRLLDVELAYDDVTQEPPPRVMTSGFARSEVVGRPGSVTDENAEVLSRVRRVVSAHAADKADQLLVRGLRDDARALLDATQSENMAFIATHGPTDELDKAVRQLDRANQDTYKVVQEKRQIRIRKKRKESTIQIISGVQD